jgi:6-pyruvoyltetrahydropterin/6-carboxytetrahydropterin synthase
MFEIMIETTFDAAHRLLNYEGVCERLHGHTYKVQVRFRSSVLQESGIALDFKIAKKMVNDVTDYFDHQYINELPEFSVDSPSAEIIAKCIYERVKRECSLIYNVSVWETPTSCATYYEDE